MINTTEDPENNGVGAIVAAPRIENALRTQIDNSEADENQTTTDIPDSIGATIAGGLSKSVQSLFAKNKSSTHASTDNESNNYNNADQNTEDNNNGNDNNNKNEGDEKGISLQELIYGASSFHAVFKPVCLTMILASLAVIYINTDATKEAGEAALDQTYQVFTISEEQSAGTNLGLGLVNGLIIVCFIGAMTFLLVLLYKYRCMKCLIGYMVVASTLILGFLGGQMFHVAIHKYELMIDQISFYFTMYNFAVVGTIAIFYQKGIPKYINQGYLVATSVVVAWQLSYFNAWMAWSLLIMLALYDLCAVLSPCGPLKALVKELSKDDAPSMPGLLYEAGLPAYATRPGRGRRNSSAERGERRTTNEAQQSGENEGADENSNQELPREKVKKNRTTSEGNVTPTTVRIEPLTTNNESSKHSTRSKECSEEEYIPSQTSQQVQPDGNITSTSLQTETPTECPSSTLPLAIAKVYKLPLVSPGALEITFDTSSPIAYLQQEFSATELQTDVEVRFPRGGGRIETTHNKKGEPRYVVYNKDGDVKRTLLVGKDGKVMEIVPRDDDDEPEDNTIKLGLGDFIFYSVLVAKAAENGFASFVACFLSVLTGLGGTLVLLAVYHHALPALPISIFVAVIMFVLTIYCMQPWIHIMWISGPYYV